jgi:hypothetical protein
MIRRVATLAVLLALLILSSGRAGAAEVEFSVAGDAVYEDNVFGTPEEKNDDVVLRFRPGVQAQEREGVVSWRFGYQPSFRYYTQLSEVTGWTHDVFGQLEWRIAPTLSLRVSERFSRVDSLNRFRDDLADEGVPPGEVADVPDFEFRSRSAKLNRFSGALTWAISPTQNLTASAGWNLDEFEELRGDNELIRGALQYVQTVTARNSFGGGIAVSQNEVESIVGGPASTSRFYNVFGTWIHVLEPTTTFSISIGPTWIEPEQFGDPVLLFEDRALFPLRRQAGRTRFVDASSCPSQGGFQVLGPECQAIDVDLFPVEELFFGSQAVDLPVLGEVPSSGGGQLTYFANAVLTKRWERWSAQLSYQRQEAPSSGLGASTVADVLSGSLSWQPGPRWNVAFTATWVRREQITELLTARVQVSGTDVLLPCPGVQDPFGIEGCYFAEPTPGGFNFIRVPGRPQTVRGVAQTVGIRTFTVRQDLETQDIFLRLNASYRLLRNLRLIGSVTYSRSTGAEAFFPGSTDRFRASVGIQYFFDPIHL